MFEAAPESLAERLPSWQAAALSLAILLLGLIVAIVLRVACEKVLGAMRFDLMTARSGLDRFFRRNGFDLTTAQIFARLVQWLVIFVFLLIALEQLHLAWTGQLVWRLIETVFRLAVSFLILIFGLMGAAALKDIVRNAAARAGVPFASMIGDIVYGGVFFFAAAAALDHLNIAREIVIIAFAIVFGAFCLALALAFGLGGQETARRWLDELTRRRAEAEPPAPAAPESVPPPGEGGD